MPSLAPPRSILPGERDAYQELLRDTRGLRREQAAAREQFVARLVSEHKEDLLFELEVLLKGIACYSNPRNHPGPAKRTPVVAQEYRDALALGREAMGRIGALCRALQFEQDRAFVFQRYLETVVPDDSGRARLAHTFTAQDSPEQSLFYLRHGITNMIEVTSGVCRLQRVPFRLFYALLGAVQREVAQSAYFNPLVALEFRPEFDRISSPRILELMRSVPGEHARRLVALTFLSLFRMLRYLALLEQTVREHEGTRRQSGVVYVMLSVLRSDARALTAYLRHSAGRVLSEGFERDVFSITAEQMVERFDTLHADGQRLLGIRATLEGIGANVRLEMRRAFEHDFPPPDAIPTLDVLRSAVSRAVRNLRPALQNAVLFLGSSLGVRLEEQGVFDGKVERLALSERLRRDVWMFAQIVRAFAHKARASSQKSIDPSWTGTPPLQFVREFLAYFQAMGYPLLRQADYPRVDAFMGAMTALEETDLLEPARMERAIAECEQFYAFLMNLLQQISKRAELTQVAFDRRAAAESLKLYLGAS
jgi:hypothetical protein